MHNIKTLKHSDVSWVDVQNPTKEMLAELEREYRLHPVHLDESIQKVQHNQVEREVHYLFMVFHVPIHEAHTNKIHVNQIGIFLGKDFLITIRKGEYPVVSELIAQCEREPHVAETGFKHGAGYLLYTLVSNMLTDISDMTDHVVAELDDIEDLVFDNSGSDAQRIGQVRQKIVKLRRVIGPKRILLKDLDEQIDSVTSQSMSKYFSNNTKTVNGLWEIIEEAKETVEIFKDADFTTSTEKTNEILKVLTLLFTFTIPITVIGTLYGMNVPLPGAITAQNWTFLGRYSTIEVVATLSIAVAIFMYLYFKKKKWF